MLHILDWDIRKECRYHAVVGIGFGLRDLDIKRVGIDIHVFGKIKEFFMKN